jgi:2,4-dienoyl-CoA reductase-like NADH-dependent reductase (Old Yellow Enzyme family)
MSALFSPFQLGSLELANRIVISPMCQYSATDGRASDWHMIHIGNLALSGASLFVIEATAVEAEGRITPGDLGLYDDATEAALKPILAAVRAHSPIAVAMQLAHAGRKASTHIPWDGGKQIPVDQGGWRTSAPSPAPFTEGDLESIALDDDGLARVKAAFVAAAKRAARLGLDAVEVHAAHGYLLHEFLSPISNQRTDAYGGSLENRLRFPLEVFEAVRAAFPAERPVGVRVSATDWVEGGWDLEQTLVFAQALKERGVAWIDASSGGLSPRQQIPLSAGYQVPFAEAIRQQTGLPVIAVGLITEPQQAEDILVAGQADLIALARGALYDPRWGWHAAATLGATAYAPPQYWRSQPRGLKALFGDAAKV